MNVRDTTIKPCFSPCMRYIAIGSEDRKTVIYDIRSSTNISSSSSLSSSSTTTYKLGGNKDTVSCVMFNPLYPQLVSGSYDGSIHFFTTDQLS